MNRVALAILVVLALAGASLGFGTYAYLSDTEEATSNLFTAGSLDLRLDGVNGVVGTLAAPSWAPGDVTTGTLMLRSVGSIFEGDADGHRVDLDLEIAARVTDDTGRVDPEDGGASDSQQFHQWIDVVYARYGGADLPLPGDRDGDGRANTLADYAVRAVVADLADPGPGGRAFDMQVRFRTDAPNHVKRDVVDITLRFYLAQRDATDLPVPPFQAFTSWPFRQTASASSAHPTNLYDWPARLTLDTATLVAQGKMRSDCADLRFTDATGAIALPYFLQSGCNTASTVAWVRVPTLVGASNTGFGVRYGKLAGVANASNAAYFTLPPSVLVPASMAADETFVLAQTLVGPLVPTTRVANLFDANPLASGWSAFRAVGDTTNEVSWSGTGSSVYLTRAASSRAGVLVVPHTLVEDKWAASFRYRAGGGSGADGFVLQFYRDLAPFATCTPVTGSGLGFNANCAPHASSQAGYGIEFDSYASPGETANQLALIDSTPTNHLARVTDSRVADNVVHHATVVYANGRVIVYIDGSKALDHTIAAPSTGSTGLALSAATGGLVNAHEIQDFALYALS